MQRSTRWLRRGIAALVLFLTAGLAYAQVAGKDFQLINPPVPAPGGKVEVIEFFAYTCPHCHALQPPLDAWLGRKPADVDFKRVPAVFQDAMLPFARIYYTIEALGLVDKLHRQVFAAYHNDKVRIQDPKVLFDWVASKGVDRQKFADAYNSFGVQSLTRRAGELTRRYAVSFTPAVVVNGRYLTGPSMTATGSSVDYDRFFGVLNKLIASSRSRPGGK